MIFFLFIREELFISLYYLDATWKTRQNSILWSPGVMIESGEGFCFVGFFSAFLSLTSRRKGKKTKPRQKSDSDHLVFSDFCHGNHSLSHNPICRLSFLLIWYNLQSRYGCSENLNCSFRLIWHIFVIVFVAFVCTNVIVPLPKCKKTGFWMSLFWSAELRPLKTLLDKGRMRFSGVYFNSNSKQSTLRAFQKIMSCGKPLFIASRSELNAEIELFFVGKWL